ncbi:MAG: hypothetical protein ABI772_03170 [Bacteroidota bacterium]
MDVLNKTIKKLSDEEYQQLIAEVSGNKKNKPFLVLETARTRDVEDSEMMQMLQVNPSAYYTLKSRLNSRIASILSKKVENPIQVIMDEVSRVPAHIFGSNRDFSIRALIELEKQLIEYDMSTELITVYKALSELHLFTDDYQYYENKYNRHVAFSLAVGKAEAMFFGFMKKLGVYQLSLKECDLEEVILLKRELSNVCELYDSHRLFVIYNIVYIYYLCNIPHKMDGLKSRELEIESTLQKMAQLFDKYPLDTFYQNIKGITDLLYFEYYQRTNSQVRADFYLQRIHKQIPEMMEQHMMHFFAIQFMRSRVIKYLQDNNVDSLTMYHDRYAKGMDIHNSETYHYIWYRKYDAIVKFYQKDFHGSARKINELRNELSMKQYLYTDVDNKLFQALNYCMLGDDSLCMQIINSLKRQIIDFEGEFQSTKTFVKILKTALKPADLRKKVKRMGELWSEFEEINKSSSNPVLTYVKLDDNMLRRLSNPIK